MITRFAHVADLPDVQSNEERSPGLGHSLKKGIPCRESSDAWRQNDAEDCDAKFHFWKDSAAISWKELTEVRLPEKKVRFWARVDRKGLDDVTLSKCNEELSLWQHRSWRVTLLQRQTKQDILFASSTTETQTKGRFATKWIEMKWQQILHFYIEVRLSVFSQCLNCQLLNY